jgi:uncharacterized protein
MLLLRLPLRLPLLLKLRQKSKKSKKQKKPTKPKKPMLSPQLQRQLKHLPSNSAVDGPEKAGSSCLFCFRNATMRFFRRMTPMTRLSSGYQLLAITVTMLSAISASGQSLQKLPVTTLNAGIHLIRAEVAATDANRQQGLMFREKMEPNEGMVFVFEEPVRTCMWMKNTLIPLSVAFIDQNGKIVNIEEMKAQSLESHCAAKPVLYALEMNRGWFSQKNIKPGTVIDGLPGRK